MGTIKLPLYLDWKGIKRLGWVYSPTHTNRFMYDPEYADRRFARPTKMGKHRNSRKAWYTPDVLVSFKTHGLPVPENVEYF